MTGDARVLASEEDLEAAIAAADAVGAQDLVAELHGQLTQVRAERERQRRVRAQRLADVFAATSDCEVF